ncbi:homeotic protein female sterile [Trichonephila clavipes]|nr:homeotic protein female sterile [Trichonephila clavipes]
MCYDNLQHQHVEFPYPSICILSILLNWENTSPQDMAGNNLDPTTEDQQKRFHSNFKKDISLYLKLFERKAQRLNIDQEKWASHLLGLLPTEVFHIIAREPDDKANSYKHVKDLLLKRFKLTPEKFRQLFVTHQKAPERTWIDFYHELTPTSTDG